MKIKLFVLCFVCHVLCGCVFMHNEDSLEEHERTNTRTNKDSIKLDSVTHMVAESGEKFFSNQEYAKAASVYSQLISINPNNKKYMFMLAECKRMLEDFDGAMYYYNALLDSPEYLHSAVEGKILIFTQKGDFLKSIDTAIEYPDIIEKSWKIHNAIAIAYASNDNIEKAVFYYNKALVLADNNPAIMNNIALSMVLTKNVKKGISLFNQILSNESLTPKLRKHISLNLALAYSMNKELEKAEEIASKYLRGREFYNNMGVYAHIANNDRLAKSFLNNALSKSIVHYNKAWDNMSLLQQN